MVSPLYHSCNFHFLSILSFFCCTPVDYPWFVCKVLVIQHVTLTSCSHINWWLQEHAIFPLQDGNPPQVGIVPIFFFFSHQTEVLWQGSDKIAQVHKISYCKICKMKLYSKQEQEWCSPTENRNVENKYGVLKKQFFSVWGLLTMSFSTTLFWFWGSKCLAEVVTVEKCINLHKWV